MSNLSALIVVVLADDSRLTFEHPAGQGHRGWFTAAMAKAGELIRASGKRADVLIVIAPMHEITHYNRNEIVELTGVQS